MPHRAVGVYPDQDGEIFVNFESGQKGVRLKNIIPKSARGEAFDDFDVSGYFSLAQMVLVTPEDLTVFNHDSKIKGLREAPLPSINTVGLGLCEPNGDLNPDRTAELFNVVAAYWEYKDKMGLELGYVATLWERTNNAEEIIKFIKDNTQQNPQTGKPELVFPKATPEEALVAALLPLDAPFAEITKEKLEALTEWLSSVPRGHAICENPKSRAADLVFLGLVDASSKIDKTTADAAKNYLWERLDQPPNYPALWRHIQATKGLYPADDLEADYNAYNLHLAELADNGVSNVALVKAILALAKTNVAIPTERLYRAARVMWELEQAKDHRGTMEKTLNQETLEVGSWLFFDKAINFTRTAQKMVVSGASKVELEAYLETSLSKASSPDYIRSFKNFYQRPEYPKTLQEIGVIDERGKWSEVGFIRQQILIAEAEQKEVSPSLEWLRLALHLRYHPEDTMPFAWALQDGKLTTKSLKNARLLASMALSGGMTGSKFQIGEVITPEQFQLLWKFGAWLADDVTVYLNYEYPSLCWLAKYTQHPRFCVEDWQEICDFVFGKIHQDPDPNLLWDYLTQKGIISPDWQEDDYQQNSASPFKNAKIGRNDPCPCGSEKKYKKCCGR